jgi:hypothetical protein
MYHVAKAFEGYRNNLDKERQNVFDYLLFELAGRREENLVNHSGRYTEAALMNILVEQELRIRKLEAKLGIETSGKQSSYEFRLRNVTRRI